MDAWINPQTRDYVLLQGQAERDAAGGLANSLYLRLTVPLGSYWADKTFGSRLNELGRVKDVARMAVLARQYAEQALAPVLKDGRATKINVSTERLPGRLNLLIEVTAASGETLNFKHPVQVI
jgi:phage gp46-like protein